MQNKKLGGKAHPHRKVIVKPCKIKRLQAVKQYYVCDNSLARGKGHRFLVGVLLLYHDKYCLLPQGVH